MATKGGEERKGEAVPVPVPVPIVTGGSCFFGTESLVACFVCLHGLMSVVELLILIVVQEYHICQGDACLRDIIAPVARPALGGGVDMLAAMLVLLLLFTGWWRRALSFFALLMVIVTVKHWVRLFYVCYIGGEIVRAAVVVAVIVVGQLAISFWTANVTLRLRFGPYGADAHSQSKRGSTTSLLLHCDSSEG